MAAILLTARAAPVNESGLCVDLNPPVSKLRAGLEAHPETPPAAGELGTSVAPGVEARCER